MINPDKLPVGVRGYRREETDDLLRRVAWDYQHLLRERDSLAEQVRKLKQIRDDLETDKELLRSEKKQLETELAAARHAAAQRPAREPAPPPQPVAQPSPEPRRDEAALALLEHAQKAARTLRESTRVECEAVLAKARKQAAEIERQAQEKVREASAEVQRLLRVQVELRSQLRQSLESLLREMQAQDGQSPRPDLGDELRRSLSPR
jgi:cell division septum initiation protein DivIVA